MVTVGPGWRPLDGDGVACLHGGMAAGIGGTLVTYDVGVLESVGRDEAVISVRGCPADHYGWVGLVGVRGRVVALPVDAVDLDVGGQQVCYRLHGRNDVFFMIPNNYSNMYGFRWPTLPSTG